MSVLPIGISSGLGYQIRNSLRLRATSVGYLKRTFGNPTDQDVFTLSMWIKRGYLSGTVQVLFGYSTSAALYITTANAISLVSTGTITSTALLRDPSAWYHVVYQQSGTTATIYVNGTSVASGTVTVANLNTAAQHQIGAYSTPSYTFDGAIADIYFVDGQALDPSSFGESNLDGVWVPKQYTGAYGNNGFHLDFSDATSTTTLGYDTAGTNDWTCTNISLTAGYAYDHLTDTPTNNFCELSPLNYSNHAIAWCQRYATASAAYGAVFGTVALPTSGKWYWEVDLTVLSTTAGAWWGVGITKADVVKTSLMGGVAGVAFWGDRNDNQVIYNETTAVRSDTALRAVTGDVAQIAYDANTGNLWFGKNNAWYDASSGTTGDPAAGTNQTLTVAAGEYFPFVQLGSNAYGSNTTDANFGQRPFAYTPPAGFFSLCTANMPAVAIADPSKYFDVKTYTGNGTAQDIGLSFNAGVIWIKNRSATDNHKFCWNVVGGPYELETNTTDDYVINADGITDVSYSGFSVGADVEYNTNAENYVAWCWKDSATSGCIQTNYISAGAGTVEHGLGAVPKMMIVKALETAGTNQGWAVYHTDNSTDPETDYLRLDLAQAIVDDVVWNDTAPTSSNFSVGNHALTGLSGDNYFALLFAEVPGFSKFSAYTGNGSPDGPFVYCGFQPHFVLIKQRGSTQGWQILDTARSDQNIAKAVLQAHTTGIESTASNALDFLSNGFKIRTDGSALGINTSAAVYIFAAFAEHPFGGSNVSPSTAR